LLTIFEEPYKKSNECHWVSFAPYVTHMEVFQKQQ